MSLNRLHVGEVVSQCRLVVLGGDAIGAQWSSLYGASPLSSDYSVVGSFVDKNDYDAFFDVMMAWFQNGCSVDKQGFAVHRGNVRIVVCLVGKVKL